MQPQTIKRATTVSTLPQLVGVGRSAGGSVTIVTPTVISLAAGSYTNYAIPAGYNQMRFWLYGPGGGSATVVAGIAYGGSGGAFRQTGWMPLYRAALLVPSIVVGAAVSAGQGSDTTVTIGGVTYGAVGGNNFGAPGSTAYGGSGGVSSSGGVGGGSAGSPDGNGGAPAALLLALG